MTIATLQLPEHWKLLHGEARENFLREEYDDAPDRDLLEIAKFPSASQKSVFAVLEHQPVGYIANPLSHPIRPNEIERQYKKDLDILNAENNLPANEAVTWKRFFLAPHYDAEDYRMDYGIELNFGRNTAVNAYRIKLIRDGALVLTLVGSKTSQVGLENWKIIPESAWEYASFQEGKDKRSQATLENLILMNRFI